MSNITIVTGIWDIKRSELSEGEENLEYKHNTKKVFEKIHSKVVEVYSKVKNLK